MRRISATLLTLFLALVIISPFQPAYAVNPDEILSDPVLEQRARDLSVGLRCLVCQNQSIDDSDADLARDLRLLVRERLTRGDTDEEILEYLVARFGEFVLLNPRFSIQTYILWATPFVLILIGAIVLLVSSRRRSKHKPEPLSENEKAALAKILEDQEKPA